MIATRLALLGLLFATSCNSTTQPTVDQRIATKDAAIQDLKTCCEGLPDLWRADSRADGKVGADAKPDGKPKPDAAKADAKPKADAAKPDAAKPDGAKPDGAKPDAAKLTDAKTADVGPDASALLAKIVVEAYTDPSVTCSTGTTETDCKGPAEVSLYTGSGAIITPVRKASLPAADVSGGRIETYGFKEPVSGTVTVYFTLTDGTKNVLTSLAVGVATPGSTTTIKVPLKRVTLP